MQHPRTLYITLLFCLLASPLATADSYPKITRYYDGDTVKIDNGLRQYKLRLRDIDAPERNQAYGKQAKRALIQLCKNAQIQVQLSGIDKYQRDLGYLHCNQQSASLYMVANGYAWYNQRYAMDDSLLQAQQQARQQKLGLWRAKSPTPPWQWRQKHPHAYAKSR